MLASRVLVALSAQSLSAVDELVTLPQLRALVIVASGGSVNLLTLATALNVNPSSATRLCDRLVLAGLLDRQDDAADRRNLSLKITPQGAKVVNTVMRKRRAAIKNILTKMPDRERADLVAALGAFAAAAGEVDVHDLWAMGWQT